MWLEDKCWGSKGLIYFNDIRRLNFLKLLSIAVNEYLLHIAALQTLCDFMYVL